MNIPPQPQVPFADWIAQCLGDSAKAADVVEVATWLRERGHSFAKAYEIALDLKRGDQFARKWLLSLSPAPPSTGAQQRHSDGAVPERSL